ncbi:MAG: Gp37-like protein [Rhodanobacter sp.]
MENPFELIIQDKAFKRVGWLGDALEITATPKYNDLGVMTVTVSARNAKLPLLMATGSRLMCNYRGDHLLGGPITVRTGKGPSADGTVTLEVHDDWRFFQNILGWPVPSSPISNQSASEYDTRTGNAESVLKAFVTANATSARGFGAVSVGANLNRGSSTTVALRFHLFSDRLIPAVDAAGLGTTVVQSGTGFVVDVFQPRTVPRHLSEASGVVASWEWTNNAPTATNVIVGGQGDGTARLFQAFTASDGRAAAWGDTIESFQDARDTSAGDVYATRATETLVSTAEKTGLKITFSETPNFRYGGPNGVKVGDLVTVDIGPGLTVTDILRQAEIKWTVQNGLEVAPRVGDIVDSTDEAMARAVRRLAVTARDYRSR